MSEFPSDWQETAWDKLPVGLRRRAVTRLRAFYDDAFFAEVRRLVGEHGLGEWLPVGWHFAQGMGVRNTLRSRQATLDEMRALPVIRDVDLPPLPELYGADSGPHGNWDDYYVQVIEAAAGCRLVGDEDTREPVHRGRLTQRVRQVMRGRRGRR